MPSSKPGGWSRFFRLVRPFLRAERRRVLLGFGGLVSLILVLAGLNVVASYVNRDVMTTIAERRTDRFVQIAFAWVAVFGVLTTVAVCYRFTEEWLALYWRRWMTGWLIDRYLADRRYYHISQTHEIDNPEQRISEDVRNFTVNTLSLFLILLNSSITFAAFIGVLWAITPWLVLAAALYAGFGTGLIVLAGRRLVRLNNRQFSYEADLRLDLARVRDHAETVAVQGNAQGIGRLLHGRLWSAVKNHRSIIGVNRRLGFFTNSFGYLQQVIPVLIVAPAYFRGEVEFGVVTQAAIAFAQVLGAISLAVTNFGQIFALAAVVERLGGLLDALDRPPAVPADAPEVVDGDRWACERLTLKVGGNHRPPIRELTFDHPLGRRLLVLGPNGVGKTELFNATAGVGARGAGRIVRPAGAAFLPMRPYSPPSTLRELVTDFEDHPAGDEALCDLLRRVGFSPAQGGKATLDVKADWSGRLSPSDLQALSVARLLLRPPAWAFLNGVVSAFGPRHRERVYQMMNEAGICYVTFSDDAERTRYHDRVLHLEEGGRWRLEERA